MLPDFVEVKRRLAQDRLGRLQIEGRTKGMAALVRQFRNHEGNRFTIIREDQSAHTSEYRTFGGEVSLDVKDMLDDGRSAIAGMLADVARKVEKDVSESFQQVMVEATNETGKVVDAKGSGFTAELFLDAIEKIEGSFEEDGTFNIPTMVMHPSQAPKAASESARLDHDPQLKDRLERVIEAKREVWRAREAHRTLVD